MSEYFRDFAEFNVDAVRVTVGIPWGKLYPFSGGRIRILADVAEQLMHRRLLTFSSARYVLENNIDKWGTGFKSRRYRFNFHAALEKLEPAFRGLRQEINYYTYRQLVSALPKVNRREKRSKRAWLIWRMHTRAEARKWQEIQWAREELRNVRNLLRHPEVLEFRKRESELDRTSQTL